MSDETRFPVVFLWHMHQPDYRVAGQFRLPWTYLHALKDYTDMAAHLEAVPAARAVVNFVPVLIEQISDYAGRLGAHLQRGTAVGDAMLDALAALPPRGPRRAEVARMALRIDAAQQARHLPHYRHQSEQLLSQPQDDKTLGALSDADLTDLLIGWHLAWTGTSILATDPDAMALLARQRGDSASDRRRLLELISRALSGILPRYRMLADAGRVELAMSPYQHALMPLLLDFSSSLETAPDKPLPTRQYPGGAERVQWHLDRGSQIFRATFEREPSGCWPSEAALSEAALMQLAQAGLPWTASSQSVLAATMSHHSSGPANPHVGYRSQTGMPCFFRDDGLSDRIGFVYKDWQPDHAIDDLIAHLEIIANGADNQLALIALDGENAWAHYARNGTDFLEGLYRKLASHPRLRLATLSEFCTSQSGAMKPLPSLRAGSWVHGQLLTWIGDTEKNLAWDLLINAKEHYDRAVAEGRAAREAPRLLGICEGSDWFWWPGSVNPNTAVNDFDELFRAHLRALYDSLGESPPVELDRSFAHGLSAYVTAGGVMRPTTDPEPWIERSAGVLLHIRSLPSGVLDHEAERFADFAAAAGFRVWQLLPISPGDAHGNPFQPASAVAGDPSLLPLTQAPIEPDALEHFRTTEADWLDDWCLFAALRNEHAGQPWFNWPAALRHRDPAALSAARIRLSTAIDTECRAQFAFKRRWQALRQYANARGILLFGDVPLFVAHNSADVWVHRELFEVDADGQLEATVGVPPDAFSETGQWWGYPPYRWDRMKAEHFRWWRRRFQIQATRFDLVRLDHFRGFAGWWRIPDSAATAIDGAWVPGPGRAAIDVLHSVLGGTRLVAEDLGTITDDVIDLRRALGIPGMRVLQFAFDGHPDNPHRPEHHASDSVCYTGTHDNDTSLGWWRSLPEWQRLQLQAALQTTTPDMPYDLVRMAWQSPAPLAIAPMQDLLELDSDARMNRPGTADGNWRWRMDADSASPKLAERIRSDLERSKRAAARSSTSS